ncbi:ABC transporter substrate-binding protein [Streptomyces coeruleorubidus]|uniref:ABC transporter substrate-binding protein n=1 Tax=Streptomyces coeruleorubidus TaxID=116188 RepID=UPI001873636C|nr:ABC transporter substrate-binding protein [Streptomyces bellus]GGU41610.1 sugar-binding protein [Streptomyces bellus]
MTARTTHAPGGSRRRAFLGLLGAAATAPLLSACGSATASRAIRFWDLPWGPPAYSSLAERITRGYRTVDGARGASYQSVPWNNYYMTFATGVAAGKGPAISTGASFQAFLFEQQGAIHHADNVVEELHAAGANDIFLPGVLDTMRTADGYVGIPWQLDMRVLWYNKRVLDETGVSVPTDWDSLLDAGRRLKRAGHYGYGTGAGAGNTAGTQMLIGLMLGNGGGLFDPDGNPDCVTDRNIEAMDFAQELVKEKIIDPACLGYSADNVLGQWKSGEVAMGIHDSGLPSRVGTTGDLLDVASPLTGPHGDKAALYYVNNLMMYRSPATRPAATERFLRYYLQHLQTYWDEGLITTLPVLKSIAGSEALARDPRQVKIVREWQPISRTYAERGTARLAAVDGGSALYRFTQTILRGDTGSRQALATLQKSIASIAL